MRNKLVVIMMLLFVLTWVGASTAMRERSRLRLQHGQGGTGGNYYGQGGDGPNLGYKKYDQCPGGTGGYENR